MLEIYYCKMECKIKVGDAPTQYGTHAITELDTVGDIICTTSRGKARSLMAWQYDVDFTHPMSIRKVNHQFAQDDMADEWFLTGDGFFLVEGSMNLRHESELDDLISQYEHEQEMMAGIYED